MLRHSALAILAALTFGGSGNAQPRPSFEVASIRRHEAPLPRSGGHLSISGQRITIEGYSVGGLLLFAYNVKIDQIRGWELLDHTFYDIVATAEGGGAPSRDDFRLMMQALLADRFRLRAHLESKEIPVYALVVGRNGPKLKPSAPDATTTPRFEFEGANMAATYPKATLADLADRIRSNAGLDRPVLDRTGIAGTYEIRLTYIRPSLMNSGLDANPEAISIFTAVEKLGLRLERQTAPFETLIIDHIEKPSEN